MMARKYQSPAHARIRKAEGYSCVQCDHVLRNAVYRGEYCFVYDKQGHEKCFAVFLLCRCGTINEVSVDMTDPDGFMTTIEDVQVVPERATKITTAPVMAEETAAL